VQTSLPNKRQVRSPRFNSEAGVTILEIAVATLILTVGLLALASSIGYAIAVSNKGRNLTNTKLVAVSMLEQMETLRNTGRLTFGQIANAGSVDNTGATRNFSGFPTGFQAVSINPGPDGIFGTSDDLKDSAGVVQPSWAMSGCSREIVITNLSDSLKRVQVTLQYQDAGGQTRNLVAVSYLNDDARSNFR
jgi:hypothetical protein